MKNLRRERIESFYRDKEKTLSNSKSIARLGYETAYEDKHYLPGDVMRQVGAAYSDSMGGMSYGY